MVMPAWNEAEGITSFLRELNTALVGCSPRFIVVDDCSTDGTAEVVRSLAAERIEVQAHEQPHNAGHGPSTLRALRLGLESGSAIIVATDGDGQFVGSDVRRVLTSCSSARSRWWKEHELSGRILVIVRSFRRSLGFSLASGLTNSQPMPTLRCSRTPETRYRRCCNGYLATC